MSGGVAALSPAPWSVLVVAWIFPMSSLFIVYQTEQALVLPFGQPRRVIGEPGLQFQGAVHSNHR